MLVHFQHKAAEFIAALFILLFTYTAVSKLADFNSFKTVLSFSPLLKNISFFIAIAIPVTELFIAALLFFPTSRLLGLYLSLAIMLSFTIYLCYMIIAAVHLPCSCGGVIKYMNWRQHIVFNLVFILLSMIAILLTSNHKLFIAINRRSRTPV
ncbi:MAG: MauE/DoxX family redox-associated membrane protein [Chitinophagaceae bacterium]